MTTARTSWRILLLPLLAYGSGCAPQKYDPAQGGFIQGVSALATGGYAARVDDKEAELQELQRQADYLEQRREAVAAENADAKKRLAAAEAELSTLQEGQARLRNQLKEATRAKRASAAEAATLQAQVDALDRDIAAAREGGSPDVGRFERLQRRQDEILESLDRSMRD